MIDFDGLDFTRLKAALLTRRPAHTLLFITEVKTFRLDTDRKGRPLGDFEVIEQGCKAPANLAKALHRIADHTAPLGVKVWLLYLRLPAFMLNVPSLQVRGLDGDNLLQALAFEAEGVTGQSSQQVAMAFHFLRDQDDMSDYWVVQIDRLVWDDLQKAAKKLRVKLGGLLHPGALPVALHQPGASEWLRVEAWPIGVIALLRTEAHLSIQTFGFDSNHWRTELEHWLEESGQDLVGETLLNNKMEMLPDTRYHFALKPAAELDQWLALWAKTLIAQRHPEIAILKPLAAINPDIVWMVGSGLAALLLCGLHAGWFVYQRGFYDAETVRLTSVQKTIAELTQQFSADGEQRDKLEKKLGKLEANANLIPDTIRVLQQRPAQLLRALADGRDEQLIVETIQAQGLDLTVQGVILDFGLASKLASFVDARLKPSNWKVAVTPVEDLKLFEDGAGPWNFKMKLTDQGVPGLSDP